MPILEAMKSGFFRTLLCGLFFSLGLMACGEVHGPNQMSDETLSRHDSLILKGQNLFYARDAVHFWPYLDSIEKIAFAEKSEHLQLRVLQLKQLYLEHEGKLEAALVVAEEVVLRSAAEPDYLNIQMEALFNKGNISFKLGQYQSAFQAFFTARKLIQTPDSCDLGYYDYSLAMVAYRQKNFQSARDLFQSAAKNYRSCKPEFSTNFRRQEIFSNIGLCYLNLNQPDSAIFWYNQAKNRLYHTRTHSASEKHMHLVALAVLEGNIGVALARMGKLEAAKNALQEELKVNLLPDGDRGHLVYTVNELCEVFFKQQKYEEMYRYLMLLDTLPELRQQDFPSYRFYHHLAQYHSRKGDQQQAVMYIDSFLVEYEQLRKTDRDLFRTDLDRSMRILESEYQLKQVQQAAGLDKQRNTYVLVLLVAVFLLFVLVSVAMLQGRRNNRALKKLNQEKDKMLRVVAHDLRNPIAAVYSLGDMKLHAGAKAEESEDWRLVRQACRGALDLIEEMLDVTDMEDLNRRGDTEWVSVNLLCADATRLIQYRADEKQLKLVFKPLPIDQEILVMPERIQRAITNLLTNAIKFSEGGSTVILQAELNEKGVLISVQDEGIGIPITFRERIFESFTAVRRSGTIGERTYGLGLSIVKEIIEAHQGKVWYISSEGKGSTFFIQLPRPDKK